MLYKIGRLLQLVGLVILPIAIAGNAARPDVVPLWNMLSFAGIGIAVFTLGWLLQRVARPQ